MTVDRLVELVRAAADGTDQARHDAVRSVELADLVSALHPVAVDGGLVTFASGTAASPGVACGGVCFGVDAVLDAADRGERSVMVCRETTPADEPGMHAAVAVVTARGGLASHAAVMARAWGRPAVCGVDTLRFGEGWVEVAGVRVHEGDLVTVDGSTGTILLGGAPDAAAPNQPPDEVFALLGWADRLRLDGVAILANADTAAQAELAFALGADGIGLCRTEHHLTGDRASLVRRIVTGGDPDVLYELHTIQRADFEAILSVAGGRPVRVRLLDAPLHEFVRDLDAPEADSWAEHNPALGLRGVRLALVRPGLYETQTRALADAVASCRAAGHEVNAEVVVPMVAVAEELRRVRTMVDQTWHEVLGERPRVTTMIETPRAALLAAELAEIVDGFSFGTNDLTQLVFGLGRDDAEARIVTPYQAAHIIDANPFEQLDRAGVGALMESTIHHARQVVPALKVGSCGEHAADPASLEYLLSIGVDNVSVSPMRVPVARLVAGRVGSLSVG